MNFIVYVLAIVVGLFLLNKILNMRNSGENKWKVFGSMDCGWTRKQVEELKKNDIPYEFLDCSQGDCKEGMPTNILPNGQKKVGFTKVN